MLLTSGDYCGPSQTQDMPHPRLRVTSQSESCTVQLDKDKHALHWRPLEISVKVLKAPAETLEVMAELVNTSRVTAMTSEANAGVCVLLEVCMLQDFGSHGHS